MLTRLRLNVIAKLQMLMQMLTMLTIILDSQMSLILALRIVINSPTEEDYNWSSFLLETEVIDQHNETSEKKKEDGNIFFMIG